MLAAFVLHKRRYGDSSLIVELFSREQGRMVGMAKGILGSRRSGYQLDSFQPLLVELRGRGEVQTLTRAEPAGAPLGLLGRRLYCGLYLNELLLRLTARQDACPGLYDDYVQAVQRLAANASVEPLLRSFEVRMLSHLGIGLTLGLDSLGQPVEAARVYYYDIEAGPVPALSGRPGEIDGSTLIALRTENLTDKHALLQARRLMRRIIDHYLEGRPLHSRQLFRRAESGLDQQSG